VSIYVIVTREDVEGGAPFVRSPGAAAIAMMRALKRVHNCSCRPQCCAETLGLRPAFADGGGLMSERRDVDDHVVTVQRRS
jgi:hypothetical protein